MEDYTGKIKRVSSSVAYRKKQGLVSFVVTIFIVAVLHNQVALSQ